jgi:hypothetical protein
MKDATIRPLSEVSRESVERYLVRRGNRPEMIAWKYFDAGFNRGRERALVWLHRGDVSGFIGLIPFSLQDDASVRDAVWTCDWSVEDPQRSPGMGVVLLRAAIRSAPWTMSLGGNELTRALLPRIAAQTIENAGIVYVLRLRLGYLLEKADRRIARIAPAAPSLASTALASIPLPGRSAGRQVDAPPVTPGVSRALEPILAQREAGSSWPAYDFDYVNWQCGRCPEIEAWTCVASAAAGERSAAVVFRRRSAPSHWRLAWWLESRAGSHAVVVLRAVQAFVHEQAGLSLSVIISSSDARRAALLQAHGFRREPGGHPLYVSAADRTAFAPLRDVHGVSYLDTDLAHLP